jgi:hypothetical protein
VAMPPLPGAASSPASWPGIRIPFNNDGNLSSGEGIPFQSSDVWCLKCWCFHERGPCQATTSS